jgi:hypothetical protein
VNPIYGTPGGGPPREEPQEGTAGGDPFRGFSGGEGMFRTPVENPWNEPTEGDTPE